MYVQRSTQRKVKVWRLPELRVAFAKLGTLIFVVDLARDSDAYGRFAAVYLNGRQLVSIPLSRR